MNLRIRIGVFAAWFAATSALGQSPEQFFITKTCSVSANLQQPYRTGMHVGFDDYVYIEALGKIRVGLFYGSTYPTGMPNSLGNGYNKERSMLHGALMWRIGPESGSCKKLFTSTDGLVHNYMVSKKYMITDDESNYVAGTYFLSRSTGELILDVNDNETGNNWGVYEVRVFIIKQYYHINRNQFNVCPRKEPSDGEHDEVGNGWTREWQNSWVNHGFNNSYRGVGKFSGCQCVYDQGKLLTGNAADTRNNQGTFDFGFWATKGDLKSDEGMHLHLILDMLPHELWVKRLGSDRLMRYSPSRPL